VNLGRARGRAEWATFAAAAAVLLAVLALLTAQLFRTDEPAAPVAGRTGEVREAASRFFVDVDVTNEGDLTAADVQVLAELTIAGEVVEGEQTVDFLAGGETARLVFSFDGDPRRGDLVVRVGGHSRP
jgi:uncharacterized protein (TIGR02588 family)